MENIGKEERENSVLGGVEDLRCRQKGREESYRVRASERERGQRKEGVNVIERLSGRESETVKGERKL